jgi:hypothetical protein
MANNAELNAWARGLEGDKNAIIENLQKDIDVILNKCNGINSFDKNELDRLYRELHETQNRQMEEELGVGAAEVVDEFPNMHGGYRNKKRTTKKSKATKKIKKSRKSRSSKK